MLPYSTQAGAGFDVFDEDDFTDRLDAYIAAPVVPTRDDLLDDYLGRRLGGPGGVGGVAGRRRTRAYRAGLVRLPPRARMLGRVLRARDSGRLVLRRAALGAVLHKVKLLTSGAAAWQKKGRSGGAAAAAAAAAETAAPTVADVGRDEWMEFACNRKGKRRYQRQRRGLVWWGRISRVFA